MSKKTAASFLGLEIAGFRLNFKSDSAGIITVLRRRYPKFLGPGKSGIFFDAREAKGRPNPFKPAVFFMKSGGLKLQRGDFAASLDLRGTRGTLEAEANEQCLDAFLRSLLSVLIAHDGGFMLHSAGLVKKGKAYLFLGKSGAGKSTLAGLAARAGARVISDEINLLRPTRQGFRVYGSPFWGEMRADGRPGSWPLGGIFLLKKGKAAGVVPCSKAEAFKLLLRCLVTFDRGPGASSAVMFRSTWLLAGATFSRLEFSKNSADFLELI